MFFVPTRFMRIFTDINISKERGDYHAHHILQALFLVKLGEKGVGGEAVVAGVFMGKNEMVEKGRKQSHTVEKGPMRGLA